MNETFPEYGLQNLILTKKGDRSMEALSRACGGIPTRANLQRLATKPVKAFPTNDVILGLAKGLRVRAVDIVHAAAVSLGVPMPNPGNDLIIMDGGKLPAESQEILHSVAENMLWWQEQAQQQNPVTPSPEITADVHHLFAVDETRVAADKGDQGIDPEQLPDS